ncbi:MAG: glycosyltransferase 87 family protein [Candidatus Nanopelagicales bacterium]
MDGGPVHQQRSRLPLVALLLASVAVVALAIAAASWQPQSVQDLQVYRDAAVRLLDGRALYPPGSGYGPDQPLPFTYPPFAALLFVPLAVVPVGSATVLWWIACAACLLWLTRRSFAPAMPELGPLGRAAFVVVVALALLLVAAPVARAFAYGQIGLFLAVLCLVDLDRAARRSRGTGLLVGIAAAVKLTPAAFALTLLAAGRRRAVVVSAAACLALWAAAALVLPDDTRTWLGLVGDAERIGPVDGAVNVTWHGLWLRTLGASTLTTALWVACSTATLAVATVRSGRLLRSGQALTAATVMGFAAVVAAPVAWLHHAVWVVPLVGIVLDDGRSWRRWVVAAGLFGALSEPATSWQDLAIGTPDVSGVPGWLWVNTCVLVMAAVVVLLRPGPSTVPTTSDRDARRNGQIAPLEGGSCP